MSWNLEQKGVMQEEGISNRLNTWQQGIIEEDATIMEGNGECCWVGVIDHLGGFWVAKA